MTRILVTGGAGFIGSHLVEHLLKTTEHEVVILDRLDETSTLHRIDTDAYQANRKRVTFVWHDLRAPLSAYVTEKLGQPEVVFHLAASTHVDRSIVDPLSFVYDNVAGTVNLMQWARRLKGLDRFVMFSTDEVFGPSIVKPASYTGDVYTTGRRGDASAYEPWDRHRSSNPYAASKSASEEFAIAYHNTYGLPVIVTHCVNVIGERQHAEKFLPLLVNRILNDLAVFIHTDETKEVAATRWYVHARNIAAALVWLVDPANQTRPPTGSKVNLGGQVELGADALAARVGKIVGKEPKLQRVAFHASRPGHDMRYALVDSLAKNGFVYPVPFEESLERTVRWYVANPSWLVGGPV